MRALKGALVATAALAWAGSAWAQTTAPEPDATAAAAAEPAPAAEPPPPPEPTAPPPTFSDAFAGGKLLFEVRARYESVDQKRTATLTEKGESFTARTRLGWETGDFHGFKGLVEFEDVRQIGPEHFAINVPGATTAPLNGAAKARYPVINDPDVTELNRLQVTWTPNAMVQATVGRQRIVLDDQRFVGNVGWRQDEQTFDALRLDLAYDRFKLFYAYVHHVNRILGELRDWDSDSHLAQLTWSPAEQLRVQAFVYALDFGNAAANSSITEGVKASGKSWVGLVQLAYNATYANQRDYNGNTPDYSLDYWGGDLAGTFDIWTAKVSYESLEGNGTRGFTTPLATTHAFQGWSDAFVQPLGGNKGFVDGLKDLNFTLNAKPRWRWDYLFNIDVLVRYHDFNDQRTGASLGHGHAARQPDQGLVHPRIQALMEPRTMPSAMLTRRGALTAAAATLAAAKAAFPSGAHAAGPGPEIAKARLGFIALTDASPLIIAKERGIFAKYGMPDVEVLKQASWAGTRDNLVLGSGGGGIDGAHILTPMPYLLTTGQATGGKPVPMNILARLNINGQGISVGNDLKAVKVGLNSAAAKTKFAQLRAAGNTAKVAMTFRGGTHDLWLRYWLAAGGINPDVDVSTIVIPPPQMVANLKAGTQDAFCVGEPWNGQTVNQKVGYTACLTSEIWMNHPEKALGMRADWVARYPRAAQAITMAVMEAQMWCDQMANRPAMCAIVSGRQYVNVPIGDILPRLQGTVDYGDGRTLKGSGHYMKFWADNASFPFKSHDLWFLTEDQRWGILPASLNKTALVNQVNRSDIWRAAAKALGKAGPAGDSRGVEKFFDGKVFDPANPAAYLASQPIKKLA